MALRRAASRLVRAVLRVRSRVLVPGALPSALVVAPHPDDESFGCGGTLALLARAGSRAGVLFVTDGGASHPGHPAVASSEIAARRRAEARSATGLLGVDWEQVGYLGERDGSLGALSPEQGLAAAGRIAGVLDRLAPRAVLLPCRRDGSSEHGAAFALVARAVASARCKPRLLEFPVWSWWNPLLLLGPLLRRQRIWRVDVRGVLTAKEGAIRAYRSQMEPLPPETTPALPAGFASMFLGRHEYLFEG